MTRLLTCAALLTAMLVAGLLAARLVGSTRSLQAKMLLDSGQCEQPCWHGIRPGETTLAEAEAALREGNIVSIYSPHSAMILRWAIRSDPPWRGSAFRFNAERADDTITFVELNPPLAAMRLGDAIAIFGEPLISTLCWRFDSVPGDVAQPFLAAHLYFQGNVEVLAYNPVDPRGKRYTPDMAIWQVIYDYPSIEPPYRFDAPRWRGFTWASENQVC
jgi:hypothetical protein